jgi:hypothetical protein
MLKPFLVAFLAALAPSLAQAAHYHWKVVCEGSDFGGREIQFRIAEGQYGETPLYFDVQIITSGKLRYSRRYLPGDVTRITRSKDFVDISEASPEFGNRTEIHLGRPYGGSRGKVSFSIQSGMRGWDAEDLNCIMDPVT